MEAFSKVQMSQLMLCMEGEEVTQMVLLLICPLSCSGSESTMARSSGVRRFAYQIIMAEMREIQRKERANSFL